jgi:hypothetical protein
MVNKPLTIEAYFIDILYLQGKMNIGQSNHLIKKE